MKIPSEVASFLLEQAWHFNQSSFIENDPISIPHSFSKKQDIEISGFWTAMLSWGNRKSIIKNCNELRRLMDYAPLDFVKNYQERDGLKFSKFVHRTFQYADSLYFLQFLSSWYKKHTSLEDAFIPEGFNSCASIESSLNLFHERFFSDDPDQMNHRTRKHVARPKSARVSSATAGADRWATGSTSKTRSTPGWCRYLPTCAVSARIACCT